MYQLPVGLPEFLQHVVLFFLAQILKTGIEEPSVFLGNMRWIKSNQLLDELDMVLCLAIVLLLAIPQYE
jgi:hypothetical protein